MGIGTKQRDLCKALTVIETAAVSLGYDLVREDARRDTRVHGEFGEKKSYASAHSVHKLKLAQDYSLFKSGGYITGQEADLVFGKLHDIGDVLGLAKRINGDLGHFSKEHNGYR